MNRNTLKALCIVLSIFSFVFTQEIEESYPRVGLTGLISDPHLDIVIPIQISPTLSISPAIGFASIEEIGTDLSFGVLFRVHKPKGPFSKFAGLGIAALQYNPSEKNDFPTSDVAQTDILISPHVGIERYIDSGFCIGLSAQMNLIQADDHSFRIGYPGKWSINTGTSLYVSMFF